MLVSRFGHLAAPLVVTAALDSECCHLSIIIIYNCLEFHVSSFMLVLWLLHSRKHKPVSVHPNVINQPHGFANWLDWPDWLTHPHQDNCMYVQPAQGMHGKDAGRGGFYSTPRWSAPHPSMRPQGVYPSVCKFSEKCHWAHFGMVVFPNFLYFFATFGCTPCILHPSSGIWGKGTLLANAYVCLHRTVLYS